MRQVVPVLTAFLVLTPRGALTCAVCNVGDATLTSMGTEKPYRGRLRSSLTLQYRTDEVGEARVDRLRLAETRLDLNLAWAPHARLFLMGVMPVMQRTVEYVNLARRTSVGPGDGELRARWFPWQDRSFGAKHLLAVTGGVKLPTGQVQRGRDGKPLPVELQPGTGSVDPLGGISYAHFSWPWSMYTSLQFFGSMAGAEGVRASRSMRGTVAGQWQVSMPVALRLGLDGRFDGKAIEGGTPERDSGGFIGYASPEILLSPGLDWMVVLSVKFPVIQALSGFHREGPIWSIGVVRDLQ
ncbi:MAG: transporter [Myxococcales bacterium]|nr:transporter [Polyangiaceae bacterium]MDW8248574.1 transporter [Myxococcales bacterium]